MKTYQKYHKHTSYSNPYTKDSPLIPKDYWEEFKKEESRQIYCTMEHGYQSPYFRIYDELEQYNKDNNTNIKFIFGAEVYWVKDRLSKDNSNCHMVLLAKNEKGRKALNKAISVANKTGYYYKPRLDLELILSLPKEDIFVTSACLAFWNKYEDIDDIVVQLNNHFLDFYLEIQANNTPKQFDCNKHILELSNKYNIPLIAGTDTHILTEVHNEDRDDLLKSSGINYPEEEGWYMDMPDYDTFVERFKAQNIFTEEQIIKAIDNTNLILNFEDIVLDRTMKLPTLYPNLTQDEKDKIFIKTLSELWEEEKIKVPEIKHMEYKKEIMKEINEILGCGMCDYFLFNQEVITKGITKYGGALTQSGRGSNVAMYLNKLLGFTNIDRISAPIHMFPERFLTKERVLESKTPPDEDFNVTDREPFMKAQREILGETSCYDLIAFGTLHLKSAFKMYARANDVEAHVANEVSKQIEKYEKAILYAEEDEKEDINVFDYVDKEEFGYIIDGCQRYLGIVDNRKGHPCFLKGSLVFTSNGYKEIQDLEVGESVLTHNNSFKEISEIMINKSDDIYEVCPSGSLPIKTTGNHPFYVRERVKNKIKKYNIPDWKRVDEIKKGDMVGIPVNTKAIIPNLKFDLPYSNVNLWWIIGRYLGDGWCTEMNRTRVNKNSTREYIERYLVICCSKLKNEVSDITTVLDKLNFKYSIQERKTVYRIYIKNKELYNYLQGFGKYAHNKFIAPEVFDLPKDLLEGLIEGYLSADGYYNQEDDKYSFKTVSKKLALGFIQCIAKVYNRHCGSCVIKSGQDIIEGRTVNRKEKYNITFTKDIRKGERSFYEDNYIWTPCKKINKIKAQSETTYNLSVYDDNSYTVNNISVHNCGSVVSSCDLEEEIGIILCKSETTKKEVLTALIESITIDSFGWLKNDFLIVDSTRIINSVYERINMKPIEINDLLNLIKDDKKVWDIYANGYTQCINQCEKDKTTQKMMKFKAKNIVELTQFIAGIRPSFKSLYSYLENRQRYQYNIKVLDDLLQNEYCDSSFILFQEDLMKILNFAGFPMKDTYTIIKAISKKKKKTIAKVKPQFIKSFTEKIIESGDAENDEEASQLAEKVWEIVDSFSSYGFNSPHGFSYAIDSVTQAWQKANYPYEFYEVVLKRFTEKGEKNKVSLLKKEMKNFNIELKPIKFRDDNRNFTAYKEQGYITQPLNSLKSISKNAPQILYDMRDIKVNTFTDLLVYVTENTKLNKTSIEILIKMNYFEEFGTINTLLKLYEIFRDNYKKTYVDKTKQKKIEIVKELESTTNIETTPLDIIIYQIDCVGYTDIVDKRFEDTVSVVTSMEFNQYGTPFANLYNINTGNSAKIKVLKWYFNNKPLIDLDVIDIVEIKNTRKKWIEDREEYELILNKYRKVV